MENFQQLFGVFAWLIPMIILGVIWDLTWKLLGLWKSARNNDLAWFICIALINTLGILPIIYILMDKNKSEDQTDSVK